MGQAADAFLPQNPLNWLYIAVLPFVAQAFKSCWQLLQPFAEIKWICYLGASSRLCKGKISHRVFKSRLITKLSCLMHIFTCINLGATVTLKRMKTGCYIITISMPPECHSRAPCKRWWKVRAPFALKEKAVCDACCTVPLTCSFSSLTRKPFYSPIKNSYDISDCLQQQKKMKHYKTPQIFWLLISLLPTMKASHISEQNDEEHKNERQ